jgi:hypothetical protein
VAADRLINRASVVLSLTFGAALVSTIGAIAWPRVATSLGLAGPAAPAPAYRAGETVDAPKAWYANAPHTLILFARASCGACDRARPFLSALVARLASRSAIVVAGGADTVADDGAFARAIGAPAAGIVTAPAGLRVKSTPTLLLVSRDGRILAAWEGVGPEDKQRAIVSAIDLALAQAGG